ncbi:MAG: helicase, partial [Deltaproteobacteria bacterium]|nr:helicase [Deltaproteobacteria bacterium]
MARDRRVVGRKQVKGELELEVRVPGRPTPYIVVLNEAHEEWECDCPSKEDVCSHVVAAVLAVEQSDGELPQSTAVGAPIRYLLSSATGGVTVERVLVQPDRIEPLKGSLLSMIGTGSGGKVASVEADLLADQIITVRVGPVTGERLDRLLGVLADARDVHWQGQPVTTSAEPVLPRAIIEDAKGGGVTVRIERDSVIREVVALGVVITIDNVLRPIGAVDLSGPRLEKLPQKFAVGRNAVPELISTTIPQLAERIPVEIRATSMPKIGGREEPRIGFEVEQDGDRLLVLPTLIYGDPPRARIDGPKLVHLGGTLPIRDADAERRLVHRLRDELNLVPGRRVELTGREAFAMQ